MPDHSSTAISMEPYLVLTFDRAEAQHLLRALGRASAYAVRAAIPDERLKARADADAYDALRERLLTDVARRDFELKLEDGDSGD